MKPVPLTLEHALELAEHLHPVHRADVLRRYTSVWQWARSRVELPGAAWAVLDDGVQIAGGVVTSGDTGILWLAAREGWKRFVARHALKVCRGIIGSGVYRRYACEVAQGNEIAQRFVERLGFRRVTERAGLICYGVNP